MSTSPGNATDLSNTISLCSRTSLKTLLVNGFPRFFKVVVKKPRTCLH